MTAWALNTSALLFLNFSVFAGVETAAPSIKVSKKGRKEPTAAERRSAFFFLFFSFYEVDTLPRK